MLARKQEQEIVTCDEILVAPIPTPLHALPACAFKSDSLLVERAIEQIRVILNRTVGRGMDEVGQYLLREFYNNDASLYRSQSHSKHASLRLLESRCDTLDLPVRRTFLANSLRLTALSRQLPRESPFLALPPSHRIELLKLGTLDRINALSSRALETKMSVQKLRELVQREREKNKSPRGRRKTPPVLKILNQCVRALRDETTGRLAFRRDDVDRLDEQQLSQSRALADMLRKRMEDVERLLA